jgi:hypothetical protein
MRLLCRTPFQLTNTCRGANFHLMLQIMADHYINIKSSPFGTFHVGNDNGRWKRATSNWSIENALASTSSRGFCPSKNSHTSDALAIQNEANCGHWFLGDNSTIGRSPKNPQSQEFVPGFVRSGFEHIYRNSYEEFLKIDVGGLPHERKYETPIRKRKADGPFKRNNKRPKPGEPLQPLSK